MFKYQETGNESRLLLWWNHWLNPLGNWHEPLPYPKKRVEEANASFLPNWLWWALRNPFHNFCHFWIGITPLGLRYDWISPSDVGWTRVYGEKLNWWKRGVVSLPYFRFEMKNWEGYAGWMQRGNFGLAFRRRQ